MLLRIAIRSEDLQLRIGLVCQALMGQGVHGCSRFESFRLETDSVVTCSASLEKNRVSFVFVERLECMAPKCKAC